MISKYRAKKTIVDGIKFDSKLEAKRYQELKQLERAGLIRNLQLQPVYELIPLFRKNGRTYRRTSYKADFTYFDVIANKMVIEDTKGFKTDVYRLKKKLFEYNYPELEIKEVTK